MSQNTLEYIRKSLQESIDVKLRLLKDNAILTQIDALAETCLKSLRNGNKVIFAGNGGSFADSQHLAAEFVSRFQFDRAPLASIALGTNSSALSAIANDFGYENVFLRELQSIAQGGDVFIPISTSGNSENILRAVGSAPVGVSVVGLTGLGGGKLAGICTCVRVPATDTARIQECHITLGHILCGLIEAKFFKGEREL